MPAGEAPPLLGTSHFRVVVGARELGFAEVGPLSSVTDDEQRHRWETVILRRSLSQSTELYDWRRKIVAGQDDRRPVTIHQLATAGGAVVNSWRLDGARPVRWSGPSFDASASGVAMEELELAYDDLVWLADKQPPPKKSRPRTPTQGA
jgi:phage tail-like protein